MTKLGVKGVLLVIIFIIPTISPVMATEWKSDGWIKNLIGPERLATGDEFGCHGYEGININEGDWIIDGCKNYLLSQTNSSRWGVSPISYGVPSGEINSLTAAKLVNSGFMVVGDKVDKTPVGLFVANRNGGSLEKNVANISILESAEEDSLVSIYWIARIYDIKVREDKEALKWLENNDNIWFTTWGEWHNHKISSEDISYNLVDDKLYLSLPNINESNDWSVPGSIMLASNSTLFSIINSNGNTIPILNSSDQNLKYGYRLSPGGVIITIPRGETFVLQFDSFDINSSSINPLYTFNNLHHGVTVVGHHVSNMRESASDFLGSPILFTWLIERTAEPEFSWPIIVIALGALIATPMVIKWLLLRDKNQTLLN